MKTVDILIPTYNQPEHLGITLYSLVQWTRSAFKIYVIDNSEDGYAQGIVDQVHDDITVLRPGGNLGWMGGINYGMVHTYSEFVLMLNDDVKILNGDHLWLQRLLKPFVDPVMGITVPCSNFVMGMQHFLNVLPGNLSITSCVSGVCLLTRRDILESVGGLDSDLPGGDDIDFSIRVRKAGYQIGIRSDVFIYHFGSLTGKSMYGKEWNSHNYSDAVNKAIIDKHGLTEYLIATSFMIPHDQIPPMKEEVDWEAETMLKYCQGKGVDVGCGNRKIPDAVGVDIIPKGERGKGGSQLGEKSQADVTVADTKLPFTDGMFDYVHARHVIEHIVDPLAALKEWVRVLKPGGKLIMAVPDEEVVDGLPLDPTHKHTFTSGSLRNLLGMVTPFKLVEEKKSDISFVMVVEV